MAFTQFCLKYASECEPQRLLFRGDRLTLNKMRWSELENVNRTVNSSILLQRKKEGLGVKEWLLGPVRGDCNDYAVTKRHQLIARGWPARTVLLSEVVIVSGEHHVEPLTDLLFPRGTNAPSKTTERSSTESETAAGG